MGAVAGVKVGVMGWWREMSQARGRWAEAVELDMVAKRPPGAICLSPEQLMRQHKGPNAPQVQAPRPRTPIQLRSVAGTTEKYLKKNTPENCQNERQITSGGTALWWQIEQSLQQQPLKPH